MSLRLENLQGEKRAFDFYLRHHTSAAEAADRLLTENPDYKELLAPYFQTTAQELSTWMNDSYEQNPQHPEHLIHKASSGHLVRSKSEALIDLFLYTNHIPFRYECALRLGSITLFPDFTIRHPRTGEFYYWEHFGKMDDPAYVKNVCAKIQLYCSHGIMPSARLITTFESRDNPLSTEMIEKIVEYHFL